MDIFAYSTLGLCAVLALCFGIVLVIDMVKDPIGQAFLIGGAALVLLACAVVSAVWLIGTKLI
jgi:hypothetical protein